MTERVRTALVGISGYGESYVRTLLNDASAKQVDFVAAADPVPERCRQLGAIKAKNIPIYPSFSSLLGKERVDFAILCTPIHLHAEQTTQATAAGAGVLCEKPLAGGLADALQMIRTQNSTGKMVAIGYQWSFSRAIQALKTDILAGTLGAPIRLKTLVSFPRPFVYFNRNSWAGKIKAPDGRDVLDSPVNNATAHYLHNMLYLLGESWNTSLAPTTLQAELYRANKIENYDNAALRGKTSSGVEILFYTAHSMQDKLGPMFHFEFERGIVTFDGMQADAQIQATMRNGSIKRYGNPDADRTTKIWQCAAAIRSGDENACPAHAALPHTLCALAAQRSKPDIVEFPREAARQGIAEKDPMTVIDGLQQAFLACFDKALLPSELGGIKWAQAGSVVPIETPDLG